MRKAIALGVGVVGAGIGLSALCNSTWFAKNAPEVRCQICRAFLWDVWPDHWGASLESEPAKARHTTAA